MSFRSEVKAELLYNDASVAAGSTSVSHKMPDYNSFEMYGTTVTPGVTITIQKSPNNSDWFSSTQTMTAGANGELFGAFTNDSEYLRVTNDIDCSGLTFWLSARRNIY